jgi:hypothetical protein
LGLLYVVPWLQTPTQAISLTPGMATGAHRQPPATLAGDTRSLADRLADRPQALRQGRPIELVDGRLQIEQYDRAGSLVWSVPLPAGSR